MVINSHSRQLRLIERCNSSDTHSIWNHIGNSLPNRISNDSRGEQAADSMEVVALVCRLFLESQRCFRHF